MDEVENDEITSVNGSDLLFSDDKATISVTTMQGYKSALKWLYAERNVPFAPEIDKWLESHIKGYKKIVAGKKQAGIMSVHEGKRPISFSGYCFLAYALMTLQAQGKKYGFMESIFGWCFQVLAWNLVGRASNVIISVFLQHMFWREDCLVIVISQHKGDQAGDGNSKEKHVYANPTNPVICPILAIAVMILCRHRGVEGRKFEEALFFGDNVDRFGKLLALVLKDENLIPLDVDLGALRNEIGSHSNRKGASTFLCGLSIALSPIAVYLRAGWSLGPVQDRYIFAGAGGDQVVGRAVAGLPVHSSDFAMLPPHFTPEGMERLREIGIGRLVTNFANYPEGIKSAVPHFIASVVYHHDFLTEHL